MLDDRRHRRRPRRPGALRRARSSAPPGSSPRLFAESERGLPVHSLAARFAAKEALIKALGDSAGCQLARHGGRSRRARQPGLRAARQRRWPSLADRGITSLHLTMTHDAGVACAFVVAEGRRMTRLPRGASSTSAPSPQTSRHLRAADRRPARSWPSSRRTATGTAPCAVAARRARRRRRLARRRRHRRGARAARAPASTRPILAWLHGPDADFAAAIAADIDLGLSSLRAAAPASRTPRRRSAARAVGAAQTRDRPQPQRRRTRRVGRRVRPRPRARARRPHAGARDLQPPLQRLAGRRRAQRSRASTRARRRRSRRARPRSCATSPRRPPRCALPDARYSMVRLGIGIYGLSPFDDADLRPTSDSSRR